MSTEAAHLPFGRLFNTPTARVLDLLVCNTGLKYSEDEISELAGIRPRTLQRALKVLVEDKIVKRRKVRHAFYYEADVSSSRVEGLERYVTATMLSNLDQAVRKARKKAGGRA